MILFFFQNVYIGDGAVPNDGAVQSANAGTLIQM